MTFTPVKVYNSLHVTIVFKVEWFRFSAKATRWREELNILKEEIKRTQRFFSHRSQEWNSIKERCGTGLLERGMAAYAAR